MKMKRHVTEQRCMQRFGGGKTERKKSLERPRCGWEDDIKTELPRNITERVRTGQMWLRRGTNGVIL
jgi:hypothetical protein